MWVGRRVGGLSLALGLEALLGSHESKPKKPWRLRKEIHKKALETSCLPFAKNSLTTAIWLDKL